MKNEKILSTVAMSKHFESRQNFLRSIIGMQGTKIKAVDNVDIEIRKSEILGLVGESGCGKTTTGRLIAMLETPTSGQIYYKGHKLGYINNKKIKKECRRNIQMIFQDPYESLDPRLSVRSIVLEPQSVYFKDSSSEQRLKMLRKALEDVGLIPADIFFDKYPHELSGGQRQRVAVARSIILKPDLIIADEPVSMLDASIRIGVLESLLQLRKNLGVSILFITHDLAIARYMCDRIAVMYLGRIVEKGKTEKIIGEALHPYTQLLISAAPSIISGPQEDQVALPPQIDDISIPVEGCKFYPRCPYSSQKCVEVDPQLIKVNQEHYVSCHL